MKKLFAGFSFYVLSGILLFGESKVSGKVFYNYTANLDTSSNNAFNMKRAYLTLANDVSESISYKVTYDMGSNDGGSAHTAFLKVAMVKWKTNLGNIMIGMQGMNMFKTMENTWGHRFIAKMPMDTYGFSPSADLGIGISRKFGPLSTSALITNGAGYKKAEDDSHKKLSTHLVYGESKLNKNDGFNIGSSFSFEPYDINDVVKNKTVIGYFGGYAGSGFRGGLEFDTKQKNDIKSQIICMYGTYSYSNRISLLARLDQVDLNTAIEQDGFQAFIAGIHCNLGEGLIVAPIFRVTSFEGGKTDKSIVINFQFKF